VSRQLLGASVAVLLLAGCGGAHQHPAPLTPAGFAAAANTVCLETKTHRGRIARLRKLRPPLAERDLYAHWLSAERLAVHAADLIVGRKKAEEGEGDPRVTLAIAEGEIAGYAGRLGAGSCRRAPGVRMQS